MQILASIKASKFFSGKRQVEPLPFDDFIDQRVGFGKYQILALLVLVLIDFNDGAEIVLISFVSPIVKYEWNLTTTEVSIITSAFYFGTATGALLTGKMADKQGRRPSILLSSSLQFIIANSFYFVTNLYQMAFIRFLYGIIFGFSLPLTTSMFSEIIPMTMRGKGLVLINFCITLGKLYGCLIAYLILDSFNAGNWRLLMIISSIPSLFVLLGTIIILKESPRFLICSGRFDEGYDILNFILQKNNKPLLSDDEKQGLIIWQEQTIKVKQQEQASFTALLSSEHRGITIRLWICWFFDNAMYYGQLIILPYIMGKKSKSFGSYILTILGEAPSIFISLYMVDKKKFGRKNSLTLFYLLASIFHFVTFLVDVQHLAIFSSIARFFMKQSFAVLYPFTTESFPTLLRTLGFGWSSGIGRLGAAFVPYLIFGLADLELYLPFLAFSAFSFLASACSFTFPFDTLGRKLDAVQNSSIVELEKINKSNNDNDLKKSLL